MRDDRADHARIPVAVRVLLDERVEAVLRREHLLDAPVAVEHAHAADAPGALAALEQAVVEERLVGAVEAADADVHDARRDLRRS